MLEEISALSPDIGIGFFLLYEDPSSNQKAIRYLKNLKDDDLKSILKSLEKSQQNFMNGHIAIEHISKIHNNQADLVISLNNCLQQLSKQLKHRKEINYKQEIERQKKIKSSKQFVFDAIRIIVIGSMAILFALSLFSDHSWTDQDDMTAIYERGNEYQASQKNSHKFDYEQQKRTQNKVNKIETQYEESKILTIPDAKQPQKSSEPSIKTQQVFERQQHLNLTSISSNNKTISQNVTFSSYDMVEKPLVYSYQVLTGFTTHQTALFICNYILYFVFWAFAIFIFLLDVFLTR